MDVLANWTCSSWRAFSNDPQHVLVILLCAAACHIMTSTICPTQKSRVNRQGAKIFVHLVFRVWSFGRLCLVVCVWSFVFGVWLFFVCVFGGDSKAKQSASSKVMCFTL